MSLCLRSDNWSLHLHSCIRYVPPLALSGGQDYARRRNRLQRHWGGATHAVQWKEALEMNVMLVQYPNAEWTTSMSMGWTNFLSVQVPAANDAQRIGPRQQAGASSSTFESCGFAAQECCGRRIDFTVCDRWIAVSRAWLEGMLKRSSVVVGARQGSYGTAKQNALSKRPELWRL